MTEDSAPPSADTPLTDTNDAPPVKKTSPRRKVGTRSKAVAVVVEGTDDAAVTLPKVRRTRKPKAVAPATDSTDAATPVAAAADAPAPAPAQPEMLSSASLQRSENPEAQIETQVIQPEEFRALEERSARQFGHPPGQPAASVADTAPSTPAGQPPDVAPSQPANDGIEPPASRFPASNPPLPQPPQGYAGNDGNSPRQDRPDYRPDNQYRPDRPGRQGQPGNYPQPPYQQPQQPRHERHERFNRHDRQNRQDRFRGEPRDGQVRQDGQGGQPQGQGRPLQDGQGYPAQGQQDGMDPAVSRPVEPQFGEGIVEVSGKGFGFLREAKRNFVQTPADVFVTPEVCRKYNLRDGQWIKGEVRRSSRGPQLFRLTELNGEDPEKFKNLPNFDELTSINPKKRIRLETTPERYTTRVMDLMTPIGKGQRGLLVAPPRTGKTTLLQHIAEAVIKNHPEMKIIILLVDERPEEVTEMRRTVPQAEIMASSNDSDLKSHTRIAQLAMERCKRLVEAGFDVFMLLDSITRMGRAFNNTSSGSRTGSGGIDNRALEIPRKIFAAARNTEEAGSLTIMATALIDTGSRGDEVIFLEFKGTGNMELVLDRKISDQRIYPAVDIFQSGTRREELLLQPWELDKINVIRRGLAGHKPLEAIERLLSFLKKFPTNAQMLTSLPG